MAIYQPAEDSYLLQKEIENHLSKIKDKEINILDMGSGSGIQAETCRNFRFNNILCADINPEAIELLRTKKFKTITSNLFRKIEKKFNLIIFNPPYLPEDEREPKDSRAETTAGKKGYEIILRFLKQAKSHLEKQGTILLLVSSLSQPKIIKKEAKHLGYKLKKLASQKLFFEELIVYEIRQN
jgi:release factor glutamine methyltransferase